MRRAGVFTALFVAALQGCGDGRDGAEPSPSRALDSTATANISSDQTGSAYDLSIYLPPGYEGEAEPLPVVYAMDSEYRFATLVEALRQTRLKVILVNVAAMGAARRWTDFTMPGAAAYYRFLTLELIPFVEASYRCDPQNRILSGHSLSGEFVVYALFLEDAANGYFASVLSAEGSFWYDSLSGALSEMARRRLDANRSLPVTLVMAGDKQGNLSFVSKTYDHITRLGWEGLRSRLWVYDLGHGGMDGPSFVDGLNFAFGAEVTTGRRRTAGYLGIRGAQGTPGRAGIGFCFPAPSG